MNFALSVTTRRPQLLVLVPKPELLMLVTGMPYVSWLNALNASARRISCRWPMKIRFSRLRSVFHEDALRSELRPSVPLPRALASGRLLVPRGATT